MFSLDLYHLKQHFLDDENVHLHIVTDFVSTNVEVMLLGNHLVKIMFVRVSLLWMTT
jgi:hypothetical protein